MRELVKENQLVTVVPQDFKNSNKGKVLQVGINGFRMELKYKPEGLIKNHICDFYSLTDNGYLYFESYIENLENNVLTVANPVKHRFLQRRKFTRIKFIEDIELICDDITHKARTLDISAGGMKLQTKENIDIEKEYKVTIKLTEEIKDSLADVSVENLENIFNAVVENETVKDVIKDVVTTDNLDSLGIKDVGTQTLIVDVVTEIVDADSAEVKKEVVAIKEVFTLSEKINEAQDYNTTVNLESTEVESLIDGLANSTIITNLINYDYFSTS